MCAHFQTWKKAQSKPLIWKVRVRIWAHWKSRNHLITQHWNPIQCSAHQKRLISEGKRKAFNLFFFQVRKMKMILYFICVFLFPMEIQSLEVTNCFYFKKNWEFPLSFFQLNHLTLVKYHFNHWILICFKIPTKITNHFISRSPDR